LCKLRQQFPQRERSSECRWVECKAKRFPLFFPSCFFPSSGRCRGSCVWQAGQVLISTVV
jgi:hypothetical protein